MGSMGLKKIKFFICSDSKSIIIGPTGLEKYLKMLNKSNQEKKMVLPYKCFGSPRKKWSYRLYVFGLPEKREAAD